MEDYKFFELLRSGLWGKEADKSLFNDHNTNWDEILKLSREQMVSAIVFDGILSLPKEFQPTKELFLQWGYDVIMIEEQNKYMNTRLVNLFKLLKENNIDPVLLKGQGLAANYINPLHRQSGDIDILIREEELDLCREILLKNGAIQLTQKTSKDMGFSLDNILVECHFKSVTMSYPKNIRTWEAFEENELRVKNDHCLINNYEIATPTCDFNSIYIFYHFVNHFFSSGTNLKQICDWIFLMDRNRDDLDWKYIEKIAEELEISKTMKIFLYIAINQLGFQMDSQYFGDYSKYSKQGDRVLTEILAPKYKRSNKSYFRTRIILFSQTSSRRVKYSFLSPIRETIFYPIKIATRLPSAIKNYFHSLAI